MRYNSFSVLFQSRPTTLRVPVIYLVPSAYDWFSLSALNCQMPPAESRIGQGSWPGEPLALFCTWQAFEGAPIFTYRLPALSSAMDFDSCSPLSQRPVTISSGAEGFLISPFSSSANRNTFELEEAYRKPFLTAMPVPIKFPNEDILSALPSLLLSCSFTIPLPFFSL